MKSKNELLFFEKNNYEMIFPEKYTRKAFNVDRAKRFFPRLGCKL